jgi:hypothetical protein
MYEGLLPAGNIAIVVFPDQEVAALVEAQQVQEALLWHGLLVDVLDGDKQTAATLNRYDLVIVPGQSNIPAWMKKMPLLESTDPLTPQEVRELKKSFQRQGDLTTIRRTKLSELALARVESLRALTLPANSLVQGCAWANDQRMVLHLLNFHVPIGLTNGGKVEAAGEFPVRLKVPGGKRVRQVKTFSTDGQDGQSVPFEQRGEFLTFRVASVRVYQVVEVSF